MPDTNRIVVVREQKLFRETEKAVYIGSPQSGDHTEIGKNWIPSSLISWNEWDGVGTVSDVELPWWVADQKGLTYEEID